MDESTNGEGRAQGPAAGPAETPAETQRHQTRAGARERSIRIAILLFGLGQLGLGIWQALSPGSFFRSIGGFGAENIHFIRDVATLYLALGMVLLVAARRPSWRVPVLAFAFLQYAFHLVNHVLDVGESNPTWAGPIDVASLALAAAILLVLLLAARSETG